MGIFKVELFKNKSLKILLKSVYGLNNFFSSIIIKKTGFSYNFKSKKLKNNQVITLVAIIDNLSILISTGLKKFKFSVFEKFLNIKLKKNFRLLKGLPVRGQRTHTNAKTAKRLNKLFFNRNIYFIFWISICNKNKKFYFKFWTTTSSSSWSITFIN